MYRCLDQRFDMHMEKEVALTGRFFGAFSICNASDVRPTRRGHLFLEDDMASNLPPGVTESMLPGNRPEDQEWEDLFDWLADQDITPDEIRRVVKQHLALHPLDRL